MVGRDYNNAATTAPDKQIAVQTTNASDVDRPGTESFHQSALWTKHNGYYEDHASAKSTINKVADWSIGKGANTKKKFTQAILDRIVGSGKDTSEEVFKNQVRVRHIDGDSYAEIVGGKGIKLKNLKPLNPGAMKVYYDDFGMLDHYGYQWGKEGEEMRFEKEEIFHLSLNRNADSTHGTGDIASLTTFLDKIKQLDEDMAVFFHTYVVPMIIWEINSSKPADIAAFKEDHKIAKNSGTDIIIPKKAVGYELIQPGKNGVDPLVWRQTWVEEVTKGGGVPALIMAIAAGTTEASAKMVYLAWQQVIEDEQNYLEKQIKLQLGLEVTFEFPATIQENLGEDEAKDTQITNDTRKSEIKPKVVKA